jgi:hypothetical protein
VCTGVRDLFRLATARTTTESALAPQNAGLIWWADGRLTARDRFSIHLLLNQELLAQVLLGLATDLIKIWRSWNLEPICHSRLSVVFKPAFRVGYAPRFLARKSPAAKGMKRR